MKEMKGVSPYIQKHVFLREKNKVCSDWTLGFLKVSDNGEVRRVHGISYDSHCED